jgi:hypothetical protein
VLPDMACTDASVEPAGPGASASASADASATGSARSAGLAPNAGTATSDTTIAASQPYLEELRRLSGFRIPISFRLVTASSFNPSAINTVRESVSGGQRSGPRSRPESNP